MNLTIPANDHGKIRVFSLSSPLPAGLSDKTPDALQAVLGTDQLNPDYIDVVDIAALGDMTLADFLVHGYDMTPDAVDRAALDALSDHAILLMSRATGGAPVTLTLAAGVTHVTTCGDDAQLAVPDPITTEAAQGTLPGPATKPKSDAAMAGRVATIALAVMFALVALMIWIGGR